MKNFKFILNNRKYLNIYQIEKAAGIGTSSLVYALDRESCTDKMEVKLDYFFNKKFSQ